MPVKNQMVLSVPCGIYLRTCVPWGYSLGCPHYAGIMQGIIGTINRA